jgi:pilus assembly protein CpaB
VTLAPPTIGTRRLPRIDARVIGGVFLVGVSVLGGLRLTAEPAPGAEVWTATADLDAGHVLTRGDLRAAEVRADRSVMAGLSEVGAGPPVGRVLRTPLRAGAPLSIDGLGGAVAPGRELTIPVEPDHALGGEIRSGDRIDVVATFDKGTDLARTQVIAREAIVVGVVYSDGLFGQRQGSLSALTLRVDPDDALALAFAVRNAEIDVLRAHGDLDGAGTERFARDSLR